jgi:hypothetical protein
MNVTLDQYLVGLERSVSELPEVFRGWAALDDDLREIYSDQLAWMLGARDEVLETAKAEKRLLEVQFRIARATSLLFSLRDELQTFMGIPAEALVQDAHTSVQVARGERQRVSSGHGAGGMTAELVSFVAAEGVAMDQLSGRVTAFNIIDHIAVAAVPTLFMRISTVSLYTLGDRPEIFVERVTVEAPDGRVLAHSESLLSVQARLPNQLPNGHRSIHTIWRILLDSTGDHRVVVSRRAADSEQWERIGSTLVTVILQPHSIYNAQAPVTVPPVAPTPQT